MTEIQKWWISNNQDNSNPSCLVTRQNTHLVITSYNCLRITSTSITVLIDEVDTKNGWQQLNPRKDRRIILHSDMHIAR